MELKPADVFKPIEVDVYEARNGGYKTIRSGLINLSQVKEAGVIVDLGCRTGISTYAWHERFPQAKIYAIGASVEPFKNSLAVFRHKLGKEEIDLQALVSEGFISQGAATDLQKYWKGFGDIPNLELIEVEKLTDLQPHISDADVVDIANVHWTKNNYGMKGMLKLFQNANRYLKKGGLAMFDTYMSFCELVNPENKHYLQHPFYIQLIGNLISHLEEKGFSPEITEKQEMNKEIYKRVLEEAGFELVAKDDIKLLYTMETLLENLRARTEHAGIWNGLDFSIQEKDEILEAIVNKTQEEYEEKPEYKEFEFGRSPSFVAQKVA